MKLSSQLGYLLPKSPKGNGSKNSIQVSFSSIAFARLFACIASPSVIYGGLLVSNLTHEQPTWFDKCAENYTRLPFMVHGPHEVCISYVYHEHKL